MNRLLIAVLILTSCRGHDLAPQIETEPPQVENAEVVKSVLFYGSDLGTIIRRYYLNNDFQNILAFISDTSVNTFGNKRLEYSIMQDSSLANLIQLKSVKWEGDSSHCILTYEVSVMATSYVKHLHIVFENDTPKVILGHNAEVFQ